MPKLKLSYDNLEDAKTKLVNTYCLFRGKALTVKALDHNQVDNKYLAHGAYLFNGRAVITDINDPEFNCSEYNIGYLNLMYASAWYYRVPVKQWRQGLRSDQLKKKASKRAFFDVSFEPSKGVCSMLENNYPSFQESVEFLKEGKAEISAFHKNFAMTYDRIHSDFILEYKGTNIGFTNNLKDMQLMDENKHLLEALKEAVG